MKQAIFFFSLLIIISASFAQDSLSTNNQSRISLHWQATVISQYHPNFSALYSGENSFNVSEPVATSLTTTLFINYKPAKHTYLIFNPEAAGGKGLSRTQGIAGFPNGEVYRVGDPKLKPFIARLYAEQRFALSKTIESIGNDENQVGENTNRDYVSVLAGKFSLTDFFDDCEISHDPRTQFMNWSLMGSGGWDYPANTRGYTMGLVLKAKYKNITFKYANTAMPTEANGPNLQWKGKDALGQVVEVAVEHFNVGKEKESNYHGLHVGFYTNRANMGNYAQSIAQAAALQPAIVAPDIETSRQYGRTKNGIYATLDNTWGSVHNFIKYSSNDGKNETWAFTEIDNSVAIGFQFDGNIWKRKSDAFGLAFVSNGISDNHKEYLQKGGYGFIIGDGALNYASENIVECYYSYQPSKHLAISANYQLVINPAYNKDRGPVSLFALRLHTTL